VEEADNCRASSASADVLKSMSEQALRLKAAQRSRGRISW
jgi:hypothetical protein